ncbi:hypothetical protein EDB80DRAFT_698886 [Ilyonectria destructans]|nr:hypothetical protein EDB80DRAFT_698886 [Ilyonectria destructans]
MLISFGFRAVACGVCIAGGAWCHPRTCVSRSGVLRPVGIGAGPFSPSVVSCCCPGQASVTSTSHSSASTEPRHRVNLVVPNGKKGLGMLHAPEALSIN